MKSFRKISENRIAQSLLFSVNSCFHGGRLETSTTAANLTLGVAAESGPQEMQTDRAQHTEHGKLSEPCRSRGLFLHGISRFPSIVKEVSFLKDAVLLYGLQSKLIYMMCDNEIHTELKLNDPKSADLHHGGLADLPGPG